MLVAWSVPDWLAEVAKVAAAIAALLAALGIIAKSPIGKYLRWVFHKIVGEPLHGAAVDLIEETVTPQIDDVKGMVVALDEKNDRQHTENATAINRLGESLHEHRLEVHDHLFEIRRTLDSHFGEARVRDERITALEGLANVKVVIEPVTGDVPVTPPPPEEP